MLYLGHEDGVDLGVVLKVLQNLQSLALTGRSIEVRSGTETI